MGGTAHFFIFPLDGTRAAEVLFPNKVPLTVSAYTRTWGHLPGRAVAESTLPVQGAGVQALVTEQDSTCRN